MKIVVTGGHHTPALAVLSELEKLQKNIEVIFIGHTYAMRGDTQVSQEYKDILERSYRFVDLDSVRSNELGYFGKLKLLQSFLKAIRILSTERPAIVMGWGSYLSVPVGLAAYILRIPLLIHEQTVLGGKANLLLQHLAKKVMIASPLSLKYFPDAIITGNPVRSEILNPEPSTVRMWETKLHHQKPLLLVTGGKLGAHFINLLILHELENLLDQFEIVHQCGETSLTGDFSALKSRLSTLSRVKRAEYHLQKNLSASEMGYLLQKAKIVISRSGANIVSELAILGKRSILIPLKSNETEEQLLNAKILSKIGSAIIIDEDTFKSSDLIDISKKLLKNKTALNKAEKYSETIVNPATQIANIILKASK